MLINSFRKKTLLYFPPFYQAHVCMCIMGDNKEFKGKLFVARSTCYKDVKRIHFLKSLRPPIQLDRDCFRKTGRQRRQIDHPDLFPQNANSKAKV